MADIKTVGLTKRFGKTVAVEDLSLTIRDGELFVLAGPTGSGKSTIVCLVAGLLEPTEGDIWIGGRPVSELAAKERQVALLFPNYALSPDVMVFENIAMPLRLQQISAEQTRQRVEAAAERVGISPLLSRTTAGLSALNLYLTALARAFASAPEVLLMDGPLANLELEDRPPLLEKLVQWLDELQITTIYTAEDQAEATKLADRMAVLQAGQLQQVGQPSELYQQPANRFVARFIGRPQMNMVEATVLAKTDKVMLDLGPVSLPVPPDLSPFNVYIAEDIKPITRLISLKNKLLKLFIKNHQKESPEVIKKRTRKLQEIIESSLL